MSSSRLHAGDRDTVELRISARPENLALARLALAGIGSVAGAPDEVVANLKVAVTEACTNAIQHGYGDGAGTVVVRYRVGVGTVEVEVEDRGGGFDPGRSGRDRPAHDERDNGGLGLGLLIIRELTDELAIESGESGSRISFSRRLGSDA